MTDTNESYEDAVARIQKEQDEWWDKHWLAFMAFSLSLTNLIILANHVRH